MVLIGWMADVKYLLLNFDAGVATGLVGVAVRGGVLVPVDDLERLDLHRVGTGEMVSVRTGQFHLPISLTQHRNRSHRQPIQ